MANRQRTGIPLLTFASVAGGAPRPPFLDSQRGDKGEHRRTVQSHAEVAHVEVLHAASEMEVPRHATGLCTVVQQHLSPKHRHDTIASQYDEPGGHMAAIGQTRLRSRSYESGDRVQISKSKRQFTIGYVANWSEEIFTIRNADLVTIRLTTDETLEVCSDTDVDATDALSLCGSTRSR